MIVLCAAGLICGVVLYKLVYNKRKKEKVIVEEEEEVLEVVHQS